MSTKAKTAGKRTREARRAARQQKQLMARAAWGLAGVAVLAFLGNLLWGAIRPRPGQALPTQPRTHIEVGDPHEPYNSDPPTSGPHAAPVREGFYDEAPPDENLVHNLEHGHVIIRYNCTGLDETQCQTLKTQIQAMMDRAKPAALASSAKKLVAVPRPGMDSLLALTSWDRLDKLTSFDEARVTEFFNLLRNKAPEPGAP